MRVFVAGGTGVVGRHLVPPLVARGHEVTATATSPGRLGLLRQMAAAHYVEDVVVKAGGAALRFGWLYGPGASDGVVEPVRERQFPRRRGGAGHTSWVHLHDAASATVLAVEQQAKGVFNIVDDEPAAANVWLPYLAEAVGAKPPLKVPSWLAGPLAGNAVVGLMTEGRGFSNAKAKRELGWQLQYPSWRQGFREGLTS